MKIIAWIVAGLLALVVLGYGGSMAASESGEVVVLSTADESGTISTTRTWVVDIDDVQWLRSGSPDSGWLKRIRAHPRVTVERDGVAKSYDAAPTPAMQEAVNDAMAAKYGWGDAYIGMLFGRGDAVPIELQPR